MTSELVPRKLLHITLHRDGSVFIQCPYFRQEPGVLAKITTGPTGGIAGRYNFAAGGCLTRHRVKLSHHMDGRAHFSQDGKIRTSLEKKSFRLDGPSSHLCQFVGVGVDHFDPVRGRDFRRPDRPILMFSAGRRRIEQFAMVLGWVTPDYLWDDFLDGWDVTGYDSIGPYILKQDHSGKLLGHIGLAGHAAREDAVSHLLTVAVNHHEPIDDEARPMLLMIGAWDHASISPPRAPGESALAWKYPADPSPGSTPSPTWVDL